MKYTILLLLITLFSNVKSQDTLLTYFDQEWKEIQKSDAEYYRKAFKNSDGKWAVEDYYIDGNLQMTGTFNNKKLKKKDGSFCYYYKDNSIKSQGNYSKDKLNGEWKWFHPNGVQSSLEVYKKDKLLEIKYWNKDGSRVKGEVKVLSNAEFIGGDDALRKFIAANVQYPIRAQESGIQGRVYIKFVVNKKGEIEQVKITRGVHSSLDNEGIRVVKSMPNWIPAREHNLLVKMSFTVPINFVLQ